MRRIEIDNDCFYHVYNRGTDRREIFSDQNDYIRFIRSMREFNQASPVGSLHDAESIPRRSGSTSFRDVEPLVEFFCYCLNPNHYHFLLRQLVEGGISEFMKRLGGGYTRYYNIKNKRTGTLFQGKYKIAGMRTPEHFADMSVYINGNSQIHGITEDASKYDWCSYPDYMESRDGTLCNKKEVLMMFGDAEDYKHFFDKTVVEMIEQKREAKLWLE